VAWAESKRTGKFYLVEAYDKDGRIVGESTDFHSKNCGKKDAPKTERTPEAALVQAQEDAYFDRLNEATGAGI
jgi:hypothetical protein